MKVSTVFAAAAFSLLSIHATTASAGQSCWGLEGQALQDCINKLVDEISDIGHEENQSSQQTVKVRKIEITNPQNRN